MEVEEANELLGWDRDTDFGLCFTDEMIELAKILLLQSEERHWKQVYRQYEETFESDNDDYEEEDE